MCVSGGSALRAPAPHDTTFTGPCRPDPKDDIYGSHLRHGVWLATLHPPFIDGGCFFLSIIFIPWQLLSPLLCCFDVLMGGLHSPPLLLLIIVGGLHPPALILLVIVGGLTSPPLLLGL